MLARELPLLYAKSSYEPRRFQHTPGIANLLADSLSRIAEPGKSYNIPPRLAHLDAATLPVRDEAWYSSLKPR